jgi:hypothetical protein
MSEDNLEEILEELRAKRLAAEKARDEQNAPVALRAAVEAERRKLADTEALAKAEREIGPVGVKIDFVETRLGIVIVKQVHSAHFKKFQDLEKLKREDVETLVDKGLAYPEPGEYEKITRELPAVLTQCAEKIGYLMGVKRTEQMGK